MSEVNILSPHLDDAVLSCWNQIGPNARVVTVFAGVPEADHPSEWDIKTGYTSAIEAMNQRIHENVLALSGTGAAILNLRYLENLYRNVPPAPSEIAEAIEDASPDDASFLAPAGIGLYGRSHPDHVITCDAGKELLDRGRDVTFYADLPYVFPESDIEDWPHHVSREDVGHLIGLDEIPQPRELNPEQQVRKRQAFAAYASQYELVANVRDGVLRKPEAYRWELLLHPVHS